LRLTEVIANFGISLKDFPFRDQVYKLSGALLKEHFENTFPYYPSFQGIELNETTLATACDQALRAINGGSISRTAQIILEGLKLGIVENNRMVWSVFESPYAGYVLDLIDQLEADKVLNRYSLFNGEPGAERDVRFGLEPELFSLIIAALVQQGALALNIRGQMKTREGENGDRVTLEQLMTFTSISKPKPIPEKAVAELFTALNVPPQLLDSPQTREVGIQQFQQHLGQELGKVVHMQDSLRDGPRLGQRLILPENERMSYIADLDKYRNFLSSFNGFTTYARLVNLDIGISEIQAGFKTRKKLEELESIVSLLNTIRPNWDYLKDAREHLPAEHPWRESFDKAQDHIVEVLSDREKRQSANAGQQLRASLDNLKAEYIDYYFDLHQKARLDREQDQLKSQIAADLRWGKLRALSKINLLPKSELSSLQARLTEMRSCSNFRKEDLRQNCCCPYCDFSPAREIVANHYGDELEEIPIELQEIESRWVATLVENLTASPAQQNLKLIDSKERAAVQEFLQAKKLPKSITDKFIDGIDNTLRGLEVLEIDGADYLLAITKPGMPCTADELEKRIRDFLQDQLKGKDRQKIRIKINW